VDGSVIIATKSRTDGSTTLSRINLSVNVGHVTILIECSVAA